MQERPGMHEHRAYTHSTTEPDPRFTLPVADPRLWERLDKTFPLARHGEIVEFEGQRYQFQLISHETLLDGVLRIDWERDWYEPG